MIDCCLGLTTSYAIFSPCCCRMAVMFRFPLTNVDGNRNTIDCADIAKPAGVDRRIVTIVPREGWWRVGQIGKTDTTTNSGKSGRSFHWRCAPTAAVDAAEPASIPCRCVQIRRYLRLGLLFRPAPKERRIAPSSTIQASLRVGSMAGGGKSLVLRASFSVNRSSAKIGSGFFRNGRRVEVAGVWFGPRTATEPMGVSAGL